MPIDLSQVTAITIPEGEVTKIECNGTILWELGSPQVVVESITLSGQTTTFNVGNTFSFGGTVTANYSDGTTADVTSSTTFSGYNMSSAGTQTVTASYTENGVTVTATYSITVYKVLTKITLSGQTTSLNRGATFSFGGTVTATYNDGSTATVTSSTTFSGYNMSKAGTYTVTASYTYRSVTKTATYSLTVNKVWSTIWSGTKDFYFSAAYNAKFSKTGAGQITAAGKTTSKQLRITFSSYLSNVSVNHSTSYGIWWGGTSHGSRATSFGSSPKTITINSWGTDVIYCKARTSSNTSPYSADISFSIYISSDGKIGVWMSDVPSIANSNSAAKFGMKVTKIEEYY